MIGEGIIGARMKHKIMIIGTHQVENINSLSNSFLMSLLLILIYISLMILLPQGLKSNPRILYAKKGVDRDFFVSYSCSNPPVIIVYMGFLFTHDLISVPKPYIEN